MIKSIKKDFFLWVSGVLAVYGILISIANIGIEAQGVYLREILPMRVESMGILLLFALLVGIMSGFFLGVGLLKRKKDAGIPLL